MVEWHFTRPDVPRSTNQYFHEDLRKVSATQTDWNLPWQDNMYLAYPSADNPDWAAFVAHVKQLNEEADMNTFYKILYVMRRAHKESGDKIDPSVDAAGEEQCRKLATSLKRAMRDENIPPPEVIVTSPLTRAIETIRQGVAPVFPSVRIVVLEDLREQLNSAEKNKRHQKEWIEQKFPAFDIANVSTDNLLESTHANTKELYEDLWSRVKGALQHIFENFPDALVIALMSHCYVLQTIQREITGHDIPEKDRKDKVEFFVGETGTYAIIVKAERK